MVTCGLVFFLVLLFVGDVFALFKGIEEWKKKIDNTAGPKRNFWLVTFYVVSTLLIILTLLYWSNLF